MLKPFFTAVTLLAALTGPTHAQGYDDPPAPVVASVHFISPANGATVSSPFKVQFGVKGMTVKPAGELTAGTGHHHLIINADATPKGAVVPLDATHLHFGKGQTETELKLDPGTYKLTMQFADGLHISYGKELSATITVTVK